LPIADCRLLIAKCRLPILALKPSAIDNWQFGNVYGNRQSTMFMAIGNRQSAIGNVSSLPKSGITIQISDELVALTGL